MLNLIFKTRQPEETKRKLVEATLRLMLRQGYAGTTVDQICVEAGLTKGSFFHHFAGKEAISRAAVNAWAAFGTGLYAAAWEDPELDPLEQLHRIFDIMISFNQSPDEPCVCMVGMMSQELARVNPSMREACESHLLDWTRMTERMLTAAKEQRRPAIDFDPAEVAWFLNSLWQGSMLIGKTRQSPGMVIRNIRQARHYVDSLFGIAFSSDSTTQPETNREKMNTITTEPVSKEFVISRTFAAPQELLWKCLTEPARMAQWLAPKGCTSRPVKMEFRPGGTYHYCMTTPNGHEMWGRAVYREIDKPGRLVWVNSFSDPQGGITRHPASAQWPLEMLTTVTLEPHDGKTALTVRWLPVNATAEEIQAFNTQHDGMRQGWTGSFDHLAAYLEKEQA